MLLSSKVYAQDFSIRHYTTDDGLPHNVLYNVVQDNYGYIWIGTDDGLARFDGGNFKVYDEKNGLNNPYVIDIGIINDSTKIIGTWGGGISLMVGDTIMPQNENEKLGRISHLRVSQNTLIAYNVFGVSMAKNSEEQLYWTSKRLVESGNSALYAESFGLNGEGLTWVEYDINHKEEIYMFNAFPGLWKYVNDSSMVSIYPEILGLDTVYCAFQAHDESLFLGGKGKIFQISTTGETKIWKKNLPEATIWKIRQLDDGSLIFITNKQDYRYRKLYNYNPTTGALKDLLSLNPINSTLSSFDVDNESNIWLTTDGDGLYQIKKNRFSQTDISNGFENAFVYSIVEDPQGKYWIGTKDGPYVMEDGQISYLQVSTTNIKPDVRLVSQSPDGRIFIVTTGKTTVFNNNKITNYPHYGFDYLFHDDKLYSVRVNNISRYSYKGVSPFEEQKTLALIPDSIGVRRIVKGGGNTLLLPSKIGLLSIDSRTGDLIDTISVNDGLISDIVHDVIFDLDSTIWIGTEEGLCKYKSGKYTCFNKVDGMVSNNCRALLVDRGNNIWVGTTKGLSRFDGEAFVSFNDNNGLVCDDVNTLFIDSKNALWVGGSKGLSRLDLNNDFKIKKPALIQLASLKVNNDPVSLKRKSFESGSTLKFDFSILETSSYNDLLIQYKLNNAEWINSNGTQFEFFSMKEGKYKFELRAKRIESGWSEPFIISFEIYPPIWTTWWAILIYFILGVSILVGILIYELRRVKLKSQLNEKLLEAETLKELDAVKSKFFSGISHEFRTPLALILGPLERVLERSKGVEDQKDLDIARRSAKGLLSLINQLLDLSKIGAGQYKHQPEVRDLILDIKEFIEPFEILAENTGIHFNLNASEEQVTTLYDPNELHKVVNNLLSNAFKFTPEGGEITVTVETTNSNGQEGFVIVSVLDTGSGIEQENLSRVFEAYYQQETAAGGRQVGTGIGLALVKEIIDLHGGSIHVESQPGEGSRFWFLLPLTEPSTPENLNHELVLDIQSDDFEVPGDYELTIPDQAALVLVVEDNRDMRNHIKSILADQYEVHLASDGNEGLILAAELQPNLIISDVMMPGVTGVALCEQLKTSEATSHIPIILLTAKASMEDKLEGLTVGADDYLTKPFSHKELIVRVRNLIDQRRALQRKFSNDVEMNPKEISVNSVDQQFMERVIKVIEHNMANYEFDVVTFANELGLSRTQLHKKIKGLVGKTPSEFNRMIRLKRAAQLLKQEAGNVSEICYQVGFNSPSYFSKCFQQQYGMKPSDFAKKPTRT